MSLVDLISSAATGSERRRALLTPVGLVFFFGLLLLLVVIAKYVDVWLGLEALLPGRPGFLLGLVLTAVGGLLCTMCIGFFLRAKGTPVPFNPPRKIVSVGPYAYARNPMLSAIFVTLFGVGFLLHSRGLVYLVTPVFIVANVFELKLVEERELERRFGAAYRQYRSRVPMFVPGLRFGPRSGLNDREHR